MNYAVRTFGFALATCGFIAAAQAQSSTTTSPGPTPSVSNTVPQAPSGGAVGAKTPGQSVTGEPTAAERQAQKDGDKVQQICKGC